MTLTKVRDFLRAEWTAFVAEAVRPVREPGEPVDEGALIERASKGAQARQLLESPLMLDFLAQSEAQLTNRLTSLPLEDDAGRRNLAIAIQTQRQWWKYLASVTQDGRVAEKELDRLQRGPARY